MVGELAIKATSMQPCLSIMNGFLRHHGAEPLAKGEIVGKFRRGLAVS
jgi:hypothetical protein